MTPMARRKKQHPKRGHGIKAGAGGRLNTRALLRDLTAQQATVDEAQRKAVTAARADGATWAEIAEMTGMRSKQAAQQKFGRDSSVTAPATRAKSRN